MPETENLHGANLIDAVYGDGPPPPDDPAECYFEASKLHLRALSWDVPGGLALDQSEELQLLTQRAARSNPSREILPLPDPEPLSRDFAEVIDARRSSEDFGPGELPLPTLSGILERSYRVRLVNGWPLRPVPSGGALYPLDLYVIVQRAGGLRPGLYHYDAFRHGLTWMREVDHETLHLATLQPEMARDATAILVIGASFWRSRFKYGQRALRFCLVEAGHLQQNILLLGTAYGLATRPIGGFLDDDFTANMDYDGVNEAPVYATLIGPPGDGSP
ncbi:SagB/ThcOx family dehydrogenase [Allosalinactinospora lopnorensis]|uniref:SagB/ThcOx family dehydrogenase n=1 Tax=Allosalinactinospora lopnorensis TaxID=1352348 RepID=UPI000623F557|nr:SagB/ThcOx family dehydrogenase [Allosalinactinospora lopnorensis]